MATYSAAAVSSPGLSPFLGSRRYLPSTDSLHSSGFLKTNGKSKSQYYSPICCILNSTTATVIAVDSHITHCVHELLALPASNDILLPKQFISFLGHFAAITLADLDPATAKVAIRFVGPFLSGYGFLFILRIVMSWYPKLPVEELPYVLAYAPTEPVLKQTRKVIPPVGGVDVTPVVWFGLLSFLNEILVGPQGLLVLLSQQV